jgi:hypothetical protein
VLPFGHGGGKGTMPTRSRRLAEQKKHQGKIYGVLGAVAMALVPFVVPRLPVAMGIALGAIWLVSWPMARNGYVYKMPTKWAIGVMAIHGGLLAILGYAVWPRLTISPSKMSFEGYPNETFSFSVRNGSADDVYDVQIPFLIGYDRHFEDKLSAKVTSNGDPPQRIYDDYNYCFGKKGDVSKVLKNEREVLIVRIRHLPPFGNGSFSITYAGGEKLEVKSGSPNFISEPYSYSPIQATMGVRGDYRICKYVIATDGMVGK